jgi:hypothetical protein
MAVTEAEWQACTDLQRMLAYLNGKASDRKLRLFVVACCRQIWPLLTDVRSRRAVEAGERFADAKMGEEELSTTLHDAEAAAFTVNLSTDGPLHAARFPAYPKGAFSDHWKLRQAIQTAGGAAAEAAAKTIPRKGAHQAEMDLARDLFGPLLFRPVTVDSAWLSWGGGTVVKLAHSIYDNRRFEDMPVLGDALEEAGCDNREILAHCRGGSPHARGCWVLDMLLGKS